MKGREKIKLPNNWPWKLPAFHFSPLVIINKAKIFLVIILRKLSLI